MSFSSEVKQELVSLRIDKSCCMLSELNALTQSCASMTLHGRGQVSIAFSCENVSVAKRIFILLKKRLEINATPHFNKVTRFGGRRVCVIRLSQADTRKLMLSLHMLHESEQGEVFRGLPRRALTRKCCQHAFLRGAFLGEGSVTAPEHDYHVEFVCNSEARAQALSHLLTRCELDCAIMPRRGAHIVYLKRSSQISTLLGLMGATRAMMHYENILAQRSLHENVLRATNCDHSNMLRQLSAAQKQISALQYLQEHDLLSALSPALRDMAQLRLNNPDASLEQLGEMLDPPLGKSGVNHRLRKIVQFAQSHGAPAWHGDEQNDDPQISP